MHYYKFTLQSHTHVLNIAFRHTCPTPCRGLPARFPHVGWAFKKLGHCLRLDLQILDNVSRFEPVWLRGKALAHGFKVLRSFLPLGLESEVTFKHDIPYEQVHEFY